MWRDKSLHFVRSRRTYVPANLRRESAFHRLPGTQVVAYHRHHAVKMNIFKPRPYPYNVGIAIPHVFVLTFCVRCYTDKTNPFYPMCLPRNNRTPAHGLTIRCEKPLALFF